jgi:splicing factor 3A subunit 1
MGEEERRSRDDKVQWDGHSSTADAASRAARTNVTLMEQIEQIHRAKGLIPDNSKDGIGPKAGSGQPGQIVSAPIVRGPVPAPAVRAAAPMTPAVQAVVGMMPIRPPQAMIVAPQQFFMSGQPGAMLNAAFPGLAPPAMVPRPPLPPMMDSGEPYAKRMRGEESLMPEADFLVRNPPVVSVKVSVPSVSDKPGKLLDLPPPNPKISQQNFLLSILEWKLNGQMLTFNMNLRDTIATLKSNLFEELTMPPGKQKLQLENMFLKDSNSLAFYNVTANNVIMLQLKERGGRKK